MSKLKIVTGVFVCVLCIFIGSLWGQTFFVGGGQTLFIGAGNGDSNPPNCPNDAEVVYSALMRYSESLWIITDPNFTVDWFLNSTHPYGDVNNDGMCDLVDKNIWDNVWTSSQIMTHKQKCWQMEKKAKSWVIGTVRQARTHLELMHGVRFSGSRPPIIYFVRPLTN